MFKQFKTGNWLSGINYTQTTKHNNFFFIFNFDYSNGMATSSRNHWIYFKYTSIFNIYNFDRSSRTIMMYSTSYHDFVAITGN